jgi:tungstate transport system permease protein
MGLLWDEFRHAVPLIFHGDPTLWKIISFTIQVAVVATACAAVIGLPIALLIGLGRFPGRRVLQVLANASLALPPVVVGFILFLVFVPQGPLGGLHLTRACRRGWSGRLACSAPAASSSRPWLCARLGSA